MDNMDQTRTIIALLQTGAEYLKSLGVEDPRTEADILLAYVCGTTRDRLYLEKDAVLSENQMSRYWELIHKRGAGMPIAYLLNRRDFMGMEFYVDERVLIPRPETELLVEKLLSEQRIMPTSRRILDLCTGSGVLAISLKANWPQASIVATDISEDALAVARINAGRFQVDIDFRQGDLFAPVRGEKFNIIVSNPPYVAPEEYRQCSREVRKEPPSALLAGDKGLDFYRRIAQEVDNYLLPGGKVLLEIGSGQGQEVLRLFRKQGFECTLEPDFAGLDRIVVIEER